MRRRISVAAALSERRIIGVSSARSDSRNGRAPTWRRYATSSIAFRTLADGNCRSTCRPHSRSSVRTAKAIVPGRRRGVRLRGRHVRVPLRGRREQGKTGQKRGYHGVRSNTVS